jgi:hypothetical protein
MSAEPTEFNRRLSLVVAPGAVHLSIVPGGLRSLSFHCGHNVLFFVGVKIKSRHFVEAKSEASTTLERSKSPNNNISKSVSLC